MQVLTPSQASLTRALSILQAGGIVIHATETCYGITCDLTNPEAVKKLFAIKKRPLHQPVSALFGSIQQAEQYLEFSQTAKDLAAKHLPGPLTIILPVRKDAPSTLFVTADDKSVRSVGLRISPHPVAMQIATGFGKPVSTTSANAHGKPEAYSVQELMDQLGDADVKPDLILDSGTLQKTPPSTIVTVEREGVRVVRQGGLAL